MPLLQGFPPVAAENARVLILGSMPGTASLRAGQYYAHPQNRFWPVMGELVGALPGLPYEQRLQCLGRAGIALWDVLSHCERASSLDTAIRNESAVANDFSDFLTRHPAIRSVLFNGAKAESSFRRWVAPSLPRDGLDYQRLPSTSPANASQSAGYMLAAWRDALQAAGIATA